jgi:CubicO group peptidase (beta-lactamase class C family)
MAEVDRVADEGLATKAFPGGVLAVGKDSALVHLRPFGRFSYDGGAPEVKADTIYDVASLTKVVATTTMAMILVDEGKLDVRKPVSSFISAFRGGAKEKVTVENLLTHSSGLEAWAPLYKEVRGKEEFLQKVVSMDLAYAPGTKSVYSDLGFFLLGEVLERVAGEPIDAFVTRRVFEPLGMKSTMFCPSRDLVACIPPTERDAWRGRLVRGEVHDENAYALGGVAPHSGLFSTAPDLAHFAQMLLDGGVYDHRRIVSRATVERFTRRADVPDSARAYGWGTPSPASSAGDMLSPRAFGHTGFTGTSMWLDPDRNLFIILLTNRVHPTRENDTIRQVRRHVADAVVGGLVQP